MKCVICGRELSNPISLKRGMGSICFAHQLEEIRSYAAEPMEDISFFALPEDSALYSQSIHAL